jgi:hypothetical protein
MLSKTRLVSVLISLVCLFSSAALAQKKTARKGTSHAAAIVCKVAAVPKGMVVVGYKPNTACAGGMELAVKRPTAIETVCADSPIPSGYSVRSSQSSFACKNRDSNQVSNAMEIARADAPPSPTVRRASKADVEARCQAEAERETADFIRRGITNTDYLLSARQATQFICMKKAGL